MKVGRDDPIAPDGMVGRDDPIAPLSTDDPIAPPSAFAASNATIRTSFDVISLPMSASIPNAYDNHVVIDSFGYSSFLCRTVYAPRRESLLAPPPRTILFSLHYKNSGSSVGVRVQPTASWQIFRAIGEQMVKGQHVVAHWAVAMTTLPISTQSRTLSFRQTQDTSLPFLHCAHGNSRT